jgi:hypothetical protein
MSAHEALKEAIRVMVMQEFQQSVVLLNAPIGFGYTVRGAPIRFGKKGFPDLFGWVLPTGRTLLIEAKTGSGRLRKAQRMVRDSVLLQGPLWFLARNVDATREYLRQAIRGEEERHALYQERTALAAKNRG